MRTWLPAKIIILTMILVGVIHATYSQSDLHITLDYQPFSPLAPLSTQLSIQDIELAPLDYHFQPEENLLLRISGTSSLKQALGNKLLIQQQLSTMLFIELGGYENYIGSICINTNENTNIELGFGLVKQYSYLSAHQPNIHVMVKAHYQHQLNSWLYLYLSGQYLTDPVNQANQFDPITYMNPLFNQSEIQYGVKAMYKDIEADFGVTTQFDTQFQKAKPINLMHSKIKIGF